MSQPNRSQSAPPAPSPAELAWGRHTASSYAPVDPRLARPDPPALSAVTRSAVGARVAQRRSTARLSRAGAAGPGDSGDNGGFGPATMLVAVGLTVLVTALSALAVGGWPVLRQWRVDLVLGNEVAGFVRAPDASGLAAELAGTTGGSGTVSGVFRDPSGRYPSFVIAAGKSLQFRPEKVVRAELAAIGHTDAPVEVHPGPLGGYVRCAVIRSGTAAGTVCLWSDHGTRGVGFFPGRPVPEAAELFGRVRRQMTVR